MPEAPLNLQTLARQTLLRYGFFVEPPPAAQAETAAIAEPDFRQPAVKDLTGWLWSSIDNDDPAHSHLPPHAR